MKMRTIELSPKFLIKAMQGKATSLASNLPDDAQLLDLKFDLRSNHVLAVIRSDRFEDIAELYPIPEFKLTYTPISTTNIQPRSSNKLEPRQTAAVKPESESAKTQNQSLPTTGIEEEFTNEQRKLLSFKIEKECVIIKPVQFLKGEWNDINDIVKSLGGKWTKGDILSYWEIPKQKR